MRAAIAGMKGLSRDSAELVVAKEALRVHTHQDVHWVGTGGGSLA
jgi:hypothetical protein